MAGLLLFATAVAHGDEELLTARAMELMELGVAPVWVDEMLLQSVLMLGYPRALVGAMVWRAASGIRAPATDRAFAEGLDDWRARGEETCRIVYGRNYDRLRENVRELHPALDAWMVTEGYGRVLSRPGLDLPRRELVTIAQIAVLGASRQLHSHLRGAIRAGVGPEDIEAVLALIAPELDERRTRLAREVWVEVQGRERSA